MLRNLHVKNLALIDEIDVEFKSGLNILTGETGAGKSIILGSVNLALGGRYSADMLRQGAEFGLVELCFQLENVKQIQCLKALDIFPEEGQIILSRKLMDGRSVSKINGETVNMKTLKEVSSILIDIHGQHEHQSLLYKKNHLSILDDFGKEKIEPLKLEVSKAYATFSKYRHSLETNQLDEETRKKELLFLEHEIEEIKSANLLIDEDTELEQQFKRMTHAKKIIEGVKEAYNFTAESDEVNASDNISRGIRALQDVSAYDQEAEALYEQLVQIDGLLNDFNRELADYGTQLEFSEADFVEIETRLNIINHLKSKYGTEISDILAYCEKKEEKLLQLQNYDLYIDDLKKEYAASKITLDKISETLTKARKKYAISFGKKIKQGLLDLNFIDVAFDLSFKNLDECTSNGRDEVEFMISTNPGEPIKPLGNVASGGELSRIMLVIKTVLADNDDIETLIFDEIDTGISGRTASKVAEKMAVIGRNHQVICITHLAQIAAMADAHYIIKKEVKGNITKTEIHFLNETESIQELSRILGGSKITDAMIQSAMEMKELAKSAK
ncbi:MAG: DNA repair protein RecN [Lachnospiraceae bacterium]